LQAFFPMGRLWKHSCALLAGLAIASTVWAGKEFPALPGQAVVPNQLLVRYKPGTPIASVTSSLVPGSQAQPLASGLPNVYLVQLPAGTDPGFSTQLSQNPSVDYVEPNRIRHITVQAPNDSLILSQWALTNIQALQTWQLLPNVYLTSGTAGAGRIKVAVIDTGADCTHPDFMNAGGSSTDAALGGQLLFSLSHAYVATTLANPMCPWQDDFGHGTHVSGTVAAATNNAIGVAALGYPLQIIEYKVLDHTGNGTDLDVANAITAAADAGASVISMSLGESGYSQTLQDAVNYAWQRNAVVVAAAGNNNSNGLFFPAAANNATGVAATDISDVKASFSNFGPSVDIAAPGVNVLSTTTTYPAPLGGSTYGSLSGTSMATPHVAALAGLIDMATPNLAAMAVVQRMQQSADGVDGTVANGGWGQDLGYGRMNAYRAISVGNLRSATVGGLVGQVVDNSGTPVASATVNVVGQTSITTDGLPSADGLFRVSNLGAGLTYTIVTSATGFAPVTMKAAVVAGADTSVTIVMGVTTGEFHGIVSGVGGPAAGVVVQALSAGLVKAAAVTDSTGAYSLLVSPGTFDLRASTMYGVAATVASNTVGANGSVAVNISMARMGSISGTVSDSIGSPVANATITVTGNGFSAGAITNASGVYQTIGIPAGTYSVNAAAAASAGATIAGLVVTNDHLTTANFTINSVVVTTNPAGLTVTVDNISYTAPQSFYFIPSSTHTIGVASPQNSAGTRSTWSNWSDGGMVSHSITGPSMPTTYTANFTSQYLLTLAASPGTAGIPAANPSSGDGYYASGTSVQVTATANPGYQFANFSGDLTGATNPQSVTMSAPRAVTANYNVQTTVTTNPPGLSIAVDGQSFTAPQTFAWAPASTHTVSVSSPQNGSAGVHYAWSTWSDGGAVSHTVITPATPTTYTANFTTQYLLTLAPSPAGGGTLTANPASPDGYYANGTSVQVTATANGGYQFANYSGDLTGAMNPQSVVMSAARSVTGSFNVTATVTTSPGLLSIIVDGMTFIAPQTFIWTPGSSHSINVASPQNGTPGTRYSWSGWSDSGAISHSVIAAAAPTTYTATFGAQYLLTLAAAPGAGGGLGALPSSSDGYYASGTSVQVTASANSGFQFANFSGDLTGSTNPQAVTMTAPRSVTAGFNVQTTIATNPPGLGITVDGQALTSPQTFYWAQGSNHTIAAVSPQNGAAGTHYVWANWSDSGAISHGITTTASPTTYTANFTTLYLLTMSAAPAGGGSLTTNPASSDGYYASGTSVQVTASANAGFQFANFSGDLTGSTNPQSVVMSAPRSVTAGFDVQTTIASSPTGLSIIVDGQTFTAPQTFSWVQGSTHTIGVASPQNGGAGTRFAWANWSDGGAISHTVTAAGTPTTYTANFSTQYLLTLSNAPLVGGTLAANPASSDGYYASGTSVQLTASAAAGFQFANFSGNLSGGANPQSVVMSAPRSVTANFNVQTTVATNPPGLAITVDGQSLTAPQTFYWALGSGHTIAVGSPQNGAAGTRYAWSGWSDGGAVSHTIVAANSTATYTANFMTQHLLTLAALPASGSLVANPASGDGYYLQGTPVQITAAAPPGLLFTGFSGDLNGSTNPQSVVMSGPRSVTGNFSGFLTLTVDRAKLNFGTANGIATSPQTIHVSVAAGVSWSASSNQSNISVFPSSGTGSGTFQVTATAGPGGAITVNSQGASGSPQIQVNVAAVAPGAPFGSFDTPANNIGGVAGAIAVTGWTLDSVEVTKVDIWRDPIAGEATGSNGLVYIGDAVFVADARPDVEALYPAIPVNYRAGWGYLLLTNFLPNNNGGTGGPGNGSYNLHAIAHNKSGALLDLGTRTIVADNAHATKPFGTIDTPGQGGTASGSAYINFGWALTQNPNAIPLDGSTITVYVDSVPVGHPTYNQFRSDIANLFPGHANSNGAVGFFYIDTTKLANGVHTISWTVFDNAGHGDGIGSRFFDVQNNGGGAGAEPMHSLNAEAAEQTLVEIDQLGWVELQLGAVRGRLLAAGEQRPLPIGSTLKDGVFYWQPPAGFLGEYQLVFERGDGSSTRVRIKVGDGLLYVKKR
jgi:subtilisin family serine protease